jgi:hypothetical protein
MRVFKHRLMLEKDFGYFSKSAPGGVWENRYLFAFVHVENLTCSVIRILYDTIQIMRTIVLL